MIKDFKSAMGIEQKPKSVVDEALDECCPKLSYEQRCYESTRVREKYSDRFPVIVERDSNSDVPAIDKCAQTPRMQEATHTLTIRCMHILHTRAGHTLHTPARCYPQAIHANPAHASTGAST